eukprot:11202557-Lingulodinium_polyedra.AAC.1
MSEILLSSVGSSEPNMFFNPDPEEASPRAAVAAAPATALRSVATAPSKLASSATARPRRAS